MIAPATVKPVVLLVLDGWGYSESTEFNAIHSAHTPVWDRLWHEHTHLLLSASGADVGLPDGQMGNSEVGHTHLGAGRLIDQDFTRIGRDIDSGRFFDSEVFNHAFAKAAARGSAVHVLGVLSTGGVHGHEDHLFAMMQLARRNRVARIYLHGFLDGRDCPPKCAAESIHRAMLKVREWPGAAIASLVGRYYAMDRDCRWQRTQRAYRLIAAAQAEHAYSDPLIALDNAYARGESDEFVTPMVARDYPGVQDGDVLVFANYRADRARQLCSAFIREDFEPFERGARADLGGIITMTSYQDDFHVPVAFPPERLHNVFGEYVSRLGLRQLRIAETEKYAHVTFFFNGGVEEVFAGEERRLLPSPRVATYDLKPEMSALPLTDALLAAMRGGTYHAIICNYANADMVGHTGDFNATIKAVEVLDACLGRVIEAAAACNMDWVITADHGNAEQMRSYVNEKVQGERHTAHTGNPVPFVHGGSASVTAATGGTLADVAPTLLTLMGLPVPAEMTGRPLLRPAPA